MTGIRLATGGYAPSRMEAVEQAASRQLKSLPSTSALLQAGERGFLCPSQRDWDLFIFTVVDTDLNLRVEDVFRRYGLPLQWSGWLIFD